MLDIVSEPACAGPKAVRSRVISPVVKQIADLQWRIKFTEMKLKHLEGYENNRWLNLVRMQEQAKEELLALAV